MGITTLKNIFKSQEELHIERLKAEYAVVNTQMAATLATFQEVLKTYIETANTNYSKKSRAYKELLKKLQPSANDTDSAQMSPKAQQFAAAQEQKALDEFRNSLNTNYEQVFNEVLPQGMNGLEAQLKAIQVGEASKLKEIIEVIQQAEKKLTEFDYKILLNRYTKNISFTKDIDELVSIMDLQFTNLIDEETRLYGVVLEEAAKKDAGKSQLSQIENPRNEKLVEAFNSTHDSLMVFFDKEKSAYVQSLISSVEQKKEEAARKLAELRGIATSLSKTSERMQVAENLTQGYDEKIKAIIEGGSKNIKAPVEADKFFTEEEIKQIKVKSFEAITLRLAKIQAQIFKLKEIKLTDEASRREMEALINAEFQGIDANIDMDNVYKSELAIKQQAYAEAKEQAKKRIQEFYHEVVDPQHFLNADAMAKLENDRNKIISTELTDIYSLVNLKKLQGISERIRAFKDDENNIINIMKADYKDSQRNLTVALGKIYDLSTSIGEVSSDNKRVLPAIKDSILSAVKENYIAEIQKDFAGMKQRADELLEISTEKVDNAQEKKREINCLTKAIEENIKAVTEEYERGVTKQVNAKIKEVHARIYDEQTKLSQKKTTASRTKRLVSAASLALGAIVLAAAGVTLAVMTAGVAGIVVGSLFALGGSACLAGAGILAAKKAKVEVALTKEQQIEIAQELCQEIRAEKEQGTTVRQINQQLQEASNDTQVVAAVSPADNHGSIDYHREASSKEVVVLLAGQVAQDLHIDDFHIVEREEAKEQPNTVAEQKSNKSTIVLSRSMLAVGAA